MRPPHGDAPPPPVPRRGGLLLHDLRQVPLVGQQPLLLVLRRGGRQPGRGPAAAGGGGSSVPCGGMVFPPASPPRHRSSSRRCGLAGGRRRRLLLRGGGLLGRGRRGGGHDRHEEVDLAPLQLGIGRQDDGLLHDDGAAVGGARGRRLPEDVLGVRLHDLPGQHGPPADLLHAPVGVHDPHHVQRPARQDARDAALDGLHRSITVAACARTSPIPLAFQLAAAARASSSYMRAAVSTELEVDRGGRREGSELGGARRAHELGFGSRGSIRWLAFCICWVLLVRVCPSSSVLYSCTLLLGYDTGS